MSKEEVVVSYIDGTLPVPSQFARLVDAYRVRQRIADSCASYPKHVDEEMNILYDALLVVA